MRHLAGIVAAFALLAGVTTLAVHAFDDRELFVPPPDAVAESYTREVMSKRWEPAKEFLADRESVSEEEMRAWQRELSEGQNVEAETVTRDDTRALVVVRVPSRGVVKNFSLTWHGGWKIE